MTIIRPTAAAGMFYPADAEQLRRDVQAYLAAAPAVDGPAPKMLIVPHAGYVYSGPVAASAYVLLKPARGTIARVVLIGPSHRVAFRGLALGTAQIWDSPLGPVNVDAAAVAVLKSLPMVGELNAAHAQEHSLEVQTPFLQTLLGDFNLVPIVAGDCPPEQVAAVLDAVWGGPETLIVVSTDLSHYLDYRSCKELDQKTALAVQALDPAALGRDQACGRVGLGGALLAAKRRGMRIDALDLRCSGDTAGGKDRVVGYGAWALYEPDAPDYAALGPVLLDMARASIQAGLDTGKPKPALRGGNLSAALAQPGAVFVTLKRDGRLRGCIGSPTAWRPLIEDVCDNAFKAAFRDPRFPPLTAQEWDGAEMSVSVLTPPVAMTFKDQADLLAQLRPGLDGLIIEDHGKRALFLPSVWAQLPDKRQFLAHLKQKAGMAVDHWSPGFAAQRFEAVEIKA